MSVPQTCRQVLSRVVLQSAYGEQISQFRRSKPRNGHHAYVVLLCSRETFLRISWVERGRSSVDYGMVCGSNSLRTRWAVRSAILVRFGALKEMFMIPLPIMSKSFVKVLDMLTPCT